MRRRVINIIDLEDYYYLIAFFHEEDKNALLSYDPWFIYYHYLYTMESVAVWIQMVGLPIQYYDTKILSTIRDRIGKTVKVDKNKTHVERGEYARISVEVNLTKPFFGYVYHQRENVQNII